MDYHVILIENGRPTHRWVYFYGHEAIEQLSRLLKAFDQVDSVTATIIKVSKQERNFTASQLLQSQIITPDHYDLD